MRRLAPLLLALAAVGAAASPAAARVRLRPCRGGSGQLCGRVLVPLDRSGQRRGRIALHVEVRHRHGHRPPLFALAGGPGQAAALFFDDFEDTLRPALRGRDTVIFDQRGTGRSGLLRCRPLERADILHAGPQGAVCARRLGARRAYYTSEDSVADMDAVRAALGYKRIAIYGVSYGTKVAELYAERHPERVERLVLDSVVPPDGPNPLYLDTLAAVPRVLRQLCARRLCRAVTRDVVGDVARLVKRLDRGRLRGYVVTRSGRRRRSYLSKERLFGTLVAGDFDPTLRAAFPTAVRSALRRDLAPILRLWRRADEIENSDTDPRELSTALYAATTCEEAPFPWDRAAQPPERRSQLAAYLAQLPDSAFAPFDRATVYHSDDVNLCLRWPAAVRAAPPPPGPLPNVPALILDGADDLRTPIEGARRVAAALPRSTLLVVPQTGHSVLSSDLSSCSQRALGAFFRGRSVRQCRHRRRDFAPDPPIPSSMRELRPVGAPGQRGRTVTAAALTLLDTLEQALVALLDDPISLVRGAGLRAGSFHETSRGFVLDGVVYVRGVRVSGLLNADGNARLRISGSAAARGVLLFRSGRVSGQLAGRRVRGSLRMRAAAAASPTAVASAAVLGGRKPPWSR